MDIQKLVDMPDYEFEQCVSQAIKGRRDNPDWWRACLHPEVIDGTESVVLDFIADGQRQAETPERFPHAAGFVKRMIGIRAEITLERIVRGEG